MTKPATRDKILQAALEVFAEKGYHRALVDDIVRASRTSKGAVYHHFPNKEALFLALVDEFSALDGGREHAVDLFERGRGAGVPVVLSGQSYRSLGDEDQRDRLVSAADALVLFGSATPDELAKLAGSVLATEAIYTVEDGQWTGRASVTHRHRAKVDANVVRQLGVGEAVIVSRGRAERLLVIPAPGRAEPRPAGAIAGAPAPHDGPARAIGEREVPPPALPRQGASPAPRRPAGGLDPSGHSSVPRKRPPGGGGDHPPDERGEA